MKFRYYGFWLLPVLACAVFALTVRFSFTDQSDQIQNFLIDAGSSFHDSKDILASGEGPAEPGQVVGAAKLVIRARFDGTRRVTGEGLYSMVTVEQVLKGDEKLEGKQICIVEEMSVFTTTRFLNIHAPYLPMWAGEEYLLLLDPVQFYPERKLTELQKIQYYPSTQSALSSFRIRKEKSMETFGEDVLMVPLIELKERDLATDEKENLDLYYRFRDALFQKYGIDP